MTCAWCASARVSARAMADPLTRAEVEERTGIKVTPKMVFVLAADGDLYGRIGVDEWYLYPPYPVFRPAEK
jgi:hypothetical protein